MRRLYIFGNGFDIAHGINTPYSAFRSFLEKEHEEFLHRFESMYDIRPLNDMEPYYREEHQRKWLERVNLEFWGTFEEAIGHPNIEAMRDTAIAQIEGLPPYGVKDTLDNLWGNEYGFSKNLQRYVLEWLSNIDTSKAYVKKKELCNAHKDFFINFNYTDTLERVYGLNNVLHIHGGVPSCTNVMPIMGHGNKYVIDKYRKELEESQKESVEWWESFNKAIINYCESLFKDTKKILSDHDDYFGRLCEVDDVVCLGMSFADVDIPYLQRVYQEVNHTTRWRVYYYGDESKERLKNVFGILGIKNTQEVYLLPSDTFWDS